MKNRTRLAIAATATASLIFSAGTAHAEHGGEEDEPGWDCETHGNRICGPTVDDANGYYDVLPDGSLYWNQYDSLSNPDGSPNIVGPIQGLTKGEDYAELNLHDDAARVEVASPAVVYLLTPTFTG